MNASAAGMSAAVAPAPPFLGSAPEWPSVYVCLLNWNGWRDTLECLESLLRLDYPDFRVLVCDNGSTDDSSARIRAWVAEHWPAGSADGASPGLLVLSHGEVEGTLVGNHRIVLIENGANLGFAGGNNSGMRFALSQPDCGFVWLLNNDTAVDAQALKALVAVARQDPRIGTCGSRLVCFDDRQHVQALGGGTYSPWFSLATHVGADLTMAQADELRSVDIDYPCAASMLVSRRFLEDVGLMSEDYFLYFEELDWMRRAGSRYAIGYAPDSLVFHKEGKSIGSDGKAAERSLLSEYFLTRARFVFTRKYHPYALPTLLAWLVLMAFSRLLRHGPRAGFQRLSIALTAAWDGLRGKLRTVVLSNDKRGGRQAVKRT